ncbi:MAG: tetratricopeptide (TPR) repeat protein [Candidatus Krumholzibacteriia bacterium]|jgi:tetratricopeptide (TPR) repeat protein
MKRKTVSLCVIAKDEEATIGMAIKSVLALVDEVIVIDTGSQDNTRIIAEGYGARVVDVPWEDDFSAARNAALDEAHCDWVLMLDADEYLQPVRPIEFQTLLHEDSTAGYRLRLISAASADHVADDNRVRLFRNIPSVRYQYPINERIMPALGEWAEDNGMLIQYTDLAIMHEPRGQDRTVRRRERNLRILQKAVVAYPDEPYFPYQLACAALEFNDCEILPVSGINRALAHMKRAWEKAEKLPMDARKNLSWLADLGSRMMSTHLALAEIDEAKKFSREVLKVFPDHPQVLLQAVAVTCRELEGHGAAKSLPSAANMLQQAHKNLEMILSGRTRSYGSAVDARVRDLHPLRFQGELALREGKVSAAVAAFEKALSLDPNYSYGWLGMAECSRFAGDRKRALKLYLRTVTEDDTNHRAWIRGCDLMDEMGFKDNAKSWWLKVAEKFPEHPLVAASHNMADNERTRPAMPV